MFRKSESQEEDPSVTGPAEVFHQFPVDRFGNKPLTVVIATGPFYVTFLLFMIWVFQGVTEFKAAG
jgi:hypothetical protein